MFQTLKLLSHRTFLAKAVLIGSLSALSFSALALPSDRNQAISLLADHATYNEKTGVTTYTGNVVIEQGTMKLQAASIVANLNKDRGLVPLLPQVHLRNSSNRWMPTSLYHVVRHKKLSTMLKRVF